MDSIELIGKRAKAASKKTAVLTTVERNNALRSVGDALIKHSDEIIKANQIDIENARANGMKPALLDRLSLNGERIKGMVEGLLQVADLEDPIGEITHMKKRPNDGVKDKALFLSSRNQRISPKTVQHIVYSYLDKAGLGDRGLSVHKLRHTAATLMYQHGNVDLLLLKEILGHENLGTTEIYTHINDQQLQNAIDNNPLADFEKKEE